MKNRLTSWKLWAGIAVVLAVLLIMRVNASFIGILPFAFLLLCPVMMMFMMGGHKHK